jgi:hypothetical protein
LERLPTLPNFFHAFGSEFHSAKVSADLPAARDSVQKLAELDVRAIVCYHGGVVNDDANGQLRRLATAGGWRPE